MSVIGAASEWLMMATKTSIMTPLLTIAVAGFGLSMLAGRIAMRRGLQLVLGCFILIGSSEIAASLMASVAQNGPAAALPEPAQVEAMSLAPLGPELRTLPQSGNPFDPYAGAKPVQ